MCADLGPLLHLVPTLFLMLFCFSAPSCCSGCCTVTCALPNCVVRRGQDGRWKGQLLYSLDARLPMSPCHACCSQREANSSLHLCAHSHIAQSFLPSKLQLMRTKYIAAEAGLKRAAAAKKEAAEPGGCTRLTWAALHWARLGRLLCKLAQPRAVCGCGQEGGSAADGSSKPGLPTPLHPPLSTLSTGEEENEDPREARIRQIEAQFAAARAPPVHCKDPSLRPLEILPGGPVLAVGGYIASWMKTTLAAAAGDPARCGVVWVCRLAGL